MSHICLSLAAFGVSVLPAWSAAATPNIVLFLADDMGYADAGFNGATDIRTPNIDRLAASGVRFTQGYCNHPFCAPSRAALLSGRYQQRFGFEDNPKYDPGNPYLGIDPDETLFPARLRQVGYATGAVGKWHLGAASAFHPCNRGFDYFFGFLGGGHDYFQIDARRPLANAYLQPLVRNGQPAGFDGYLTTALSRDAARFVERNRDRPFFLFVSYNAPHGPLQAPDRAIARYASISDPKRRVYAAMVDEMDRGIGLVMGELRRHDLTEDTLVFFLSDNGGPISMRWNADYGNGSSNAPLRGGKTNLYEGGVRVPFLASWPAKLPAGVDYDRPVIALDIARTAVEVAGGDALAEPPMEGVNLTPYLTGQRPGQPHEALYWRDRDGDRWAVVTEGGDKCVVDRIGADPALFRLADDIGEQRDTAATSPERVTELRRRWEAWDSQNQPGRIMSYLDYSELQQAFYRETATAAGRNSSGARAGGD